ncbi:MAG: glycosyltransferase family 4 protein [Bacteroidales bacterium]
MQTISFLLPAIGKCPSGGYKIVYEYANRFANDGINVNLVFPASLLFRSRSLFEKGKSILRYIYYFLTRSYKSFDWFNLHPKIKIKLVWSLDEAFAPNSDIYIATAAETAIYLNKYKRKNIRKFYFVQGYESWSIGEEKFLETLRYDLIKITIAPHLKKAIEKQSQKAFLVYNGFDESVFHITIPIEKKNKFQATMLFHTSPLKGVEDGLKAVMIVKEKFPEFQLTLFGAYNQPKNLPSWIKYFQSPNKETHRKIYNEAAIFIAPSHSEGLGLTPPEAMMCGCAVACTDIEGYAVNCKNQITALVSPVYNSELLANNIIKLIENDELRFSIAESGNNWLKDFTWENAYNQFKSIIL